MQARQALCPGAFHVRLRVATPAKPSYQLVKATESVTRQESRLLNHATFSRQWPKSVTQEGILAETQVAQERDTGEYSRRDAVKACFKANDRHNWGKESSLAELRVTLAWCYGGLISVTIRLTWPKSVDTGGFVIEMRRAAGIDSDSEHGLHSGRTSLPADKESQTAESRDLLMCRNVLSY
ncbi:hypothetical protein J6590_053149 [Homalodisca vitripennis]|nr:hypothetical protein J6590_053149 [Homalodisca vitripennis]